jgi:hypothetical protein
MVFSIVTGKHKKPSPFPMMAEGESATPFLSLGDIRVISPGGAG